MTPQEVTQIDGGEILANKYRVKDDNGVIVIAARLLGDKWVKTDAGERLRVARIVEDAKEVAPAQPVEVPKKRRTRQIVEAPVEFELSSDIVEE